ncbi:uncharacterized protein LOC117174958 isoform X2 [Belonocnema kinseyi]|uniref:uncharacterized protein LOC117174958 isoform X2 n=1 Tax=Belonocnema kinseyi TaxID=2817044 RepID=UPI00143D5CB1|nr:uncharacterized protein LOC117174958 isoform X2 [Belonocnema kinseyi]
MGKTAKVFDTRDKSQSVRDIFPKCVKKKKRKKDLDNLRKQVVASKHAMKNPAKIKARKTPFGKTLTDFAERRQAIEDNTQDIEKVKKQEQKKICPKLLADPFIGLFKNGARGNEVNREHGFFNETDKARFNGNVFRLLRGDDSIVEKAADGLHDKKSRTSPEDPKLSRNFIKPSPVLVKSLKNKRKPGLLKAVKEEKCGQKPNLQGASRKYDTDSSENFEEISEEDIFDSLMMKYQKKSGNERTELGQKVASKTVDDEYQRGRELVRRNQESPEKSKSFSIERCKQICDMVSQQIASENSFMSSENDPLKKTRLSLKRLYCDSHRQQLLRDKVASPETDKLSTSSLDSIETQRFANHLKEKSQVKGSKEKRLFVFKLKYDNCQENIVDLNQITEGPKSQEEPKKYRKEKLLKLKNSSIASSSEASFISEIKSNFDLTKDTQLFFNDFLSSSTKPAKKLAKECQLFRTHHEKNVALHESNNQDSKHAPFILRRSDKSAKNIFKDAFHDVPIESPINLSQTESEDSIKFLKTPNAKKVARDERSRLLNSKLNFMAAKNRQVQSRITRSPGRLYSTGKSEEKRKHVLRFEDLFKHVSPHHFSHNFPAPQPSHVETNMFVNQERSSLVQQQDSRTQRKRHSSSFKPQVRNEEQVRVQSRNIQDIHQQGPGDCRLILLQPPPENYPRSFEDRIDHHGNIQFYENPQQPINCLQPSFFSSAGTSKQPSDLNIMNGVGNLNLLASTLGQPVIGQPVIHQSSSNPQNHPTSQPIKFVALENNQQVQRRVPIYFHDNKPYIAVYPTSEPNKNNSQNFFPQEYVHHANVPFVQNKPRVVSCMQCANNSASGSLFCHQNLPSAPPMAHQNSFPANHQHLYDIDKACNASGPEVRFINGNNVQHGIQVLGFDESHAGNHGLAQVYVTGRQDL